GVRHTEGFAEPVQAEHQGGFPLSRISRHPSTFGGPTNSADRTWSLGDPPNSLAASRIHSPATEVSQPAEIVPLSSHCRRLLRPSPNWTNGCRLETDDCLTAGSHPAGPHVPGLSTRSQMFGRNPARCQGTNGESRSA